MTQQALAVRKEVTFDAEQTELVKRTIMPPVKKKEKGEWIEKPASDDELQLFIYVCKEKNLNPLTREIYAMRNKEGRLTFMTSIDGLRIQAERGGYYAGQVGPFWCGEDGVWKDVWLSNEYPVAAKVGVLRHGFKEPVYGIAKFKSYAQWKDEYENGQKTGKRTLIGFWAKGDEHMLAKCAEAIALRKAFPTQLGESGAAALYIAEEAHAIAGDERGSKEAAQAVAEAKIAALKGQEPPTEAPTADFKPPKAVIPEFQPPAYIGFLHLSWDEDGMIAYLSGDAKLLDLIGAELREVLATWSDAKKRWIIPRDGVQQVKDACEREKIQVLDSANLPENRVLPSPQVQAEGASASPAATGPIIKDCGMTKTASKKGKEGQEIGLKPYMKVVWGDVVFNLFDRYKVLWPYIEAAKGKPAMFTLVPDGKYHNFESVGHINGVTFTNIEGKGWTPDRQVGE